LVKNNQHGFRGEVGEWLVLKVIPSIAYSTQKIGSQVSKIWSSFFCFFTMALKISLLKPTSNIDAKLLLSKA
jgi:hypothetical protein